MNTNTEFFTDYELEVVRETAAACERARKAGFRPEECAFSPEMVVFENVRDLLNWTPAQLRVLEFCAKECERQKEDEMAVYNYVVAWNAAIAAKRQGLRWTEELAMEISMLIEPSDGPCYRDQNAVHNDTKQVIGSEHQHVPGDMRSHFAFVEAYEDGVRETYSCPLSAQALYVDLQAIHPKENGNGRWGVLEFNCLLDDGLHTLEDPMSPVEPVTFTRIKF